MSVFVLTKEEDRVRKFHAEQLEKTAKALQAELVRVNAVVAEAYAALETRVADFNRAAEAADGAIDGILQRLEFDLEAHNAAKGWAKTEEAKGARRLVRAWGIDFPALELMPPEPLYFPDLGLGETYDSTATYAEEIRLLPLSGEAALAEEAEG